MATKARCVFRSTAMPAWMGAVTLLLLALAMAVPAVAAAEQDSPYRPDAIPPRQYQPGSVSVPSSEPNRPEDHFAAIYSGSASGVYFYVASSICKVMARNLDRHRVHCVALRSTGVGGNVSLMQQGRAQFAIIQSDTNLQAEIGMIPLARGRSVMSLHTESGVLLVRPESEIRSVADLRGKRVNLGPKGTASRQLFDQILRYYDVPQDALAEVFEVRQSYNVQGLCDRHIDAFAVWIGHPAQVVEDAVKTCGARIVGLDNPPEGALPAETGANQPAVARLLADHRYYAPAVLAPGTYPGQTDPIYSYGFKASLIAAAEASPYVVEAVTRTLIENVDVLKDTLPALSGLEAERMFKEGNFLPFHEGAAAYWQERGWLTDAPAEEAEDSAEYID